LNPAGFPTPVPAVFGPELTGYREWLGADYLGPLDRSMNSAGITV
jgi:vanillate/3-O-methylgallate O-demethylase